MSKRTQAKISFRRRVENFLDDVVYTLSPTRGAARRAVRASWDAAAAKHARLLSRFEAGENERTHGSKWMSSRLSPDSALELDLETTRQRSRELYQNDPIGGAVETLVDHVIGCGFRPRPKLKPRDGFLTEAQADALHDELLDLFERWGSRVDRSRRQSLWEVARLVQRTAAIDGECFIVMSDVGSGDSPIPLVLEVIDADRVETPPEKAADPNVRMGIERDEQQRIVAYWIRNTNPYDTRNVDLRYQRIDAVRVLHVFEQFFPGQSRGLPWMVRVLNRARDVKDFDEATIIAAQVEACFAMFIENGSANGAPINPATMAAGMAGTVTSSGDRLEDLEPGTVRYLGPGQKPHFANPTKPSGTFEPFMQWNHRRMAAGLVFPYEMLAKNWMGLSFAGGRLALAEGRLNFAVRQELLVQKFFQWVWRRMVLEGVIAGELSIRQADYRRKPWIYERHAWIPPAWPYALTPGEEVDAAVTRIENNLSTKEEELAALGRDFEEVLEQRMYEREQERAAGIEPPAASAPQPAAEDSADPNEDDEDTEPADAARQLARELAEAAR